MRRRALEIIFSLVLLSSPAVCQTQTNELTLSCNGKSKVDSIETAINGIGLVVNLEKMIVSSFILFDVVAGIDKSDDAAISFEGENDGEIERVWVSGLIDRITGAASMVIHTDSKVKGIPSSTTYLNLTCAVTKRLF